MRRVKRISPAICLSLSLSFISGCETVVYWEKLPPLTTPRVVRIIGDNEAILRGVKITQRLVDAARLPASTIFVMTLTHYRTNVNKSPLYFDYRARAFRCAPKGEQLHETLPPSSGCIVLPEDDLDRLSDDALAALIAHELGHIEKGHKSWEGAAEPTLIQWEADEAAINRLYLAGYCAGETLRKAGKEMALVYGPGARHPWQDYPADCKPKEYKDRAIEDSALAFYNRGRANQENRNYDQAIQDYSRAIERDPKYSVAFNGRGSAYHAQKDYDRAIQDYNDALRLNPNFASAFNNRGIAYYDKRDYDRAIEDYDQAIRLDPKYAAAFNNRGNVYRDKRDYDRAIQDYDEAIRLNPNYALAFNNRGIAYRSKRENERAIQDYDRAIKLNPKYAAAFNNRGNVYRDMRDYDRAIQDYDEAIHLNPNYVLALNNRGRAYNEKRQYDRALADYEAAGRIDPASASHFRIARAFFYLGRFAESAEASLQALMASPQNKYVILWRYIAQARSNGVRAASEELVVNAAKLTEQRWPAPIIGFYLGKVGEKEMYAAADSSDPKKKNEQLCEANFYAAQAKFLGNATTEAVPLLRAAEKDCPPTFVEAHGASAELRRLAY